MTLFLLLLLLPAFIPGAKRERSISRVLPQYQRACIHAPCEKAEFLIPQGLLYLFLHSTVSEYSVSSDENRVGGREAYTRTTPGSDIRLKAPLLLQPQPFLPYLFSHPTLSLPVQTPTPASHRSSQARRELKGPTKSPEPERQ